AIECPSAGCAIGICADGGCTLEPRPEACDDGDPCTAEACGADGRCARAIAPDGTPCGAVEGCRSAPVCVAGRCQALAGPERFPCDDGDRCTEGDRCADSVCVSGLPTIHGSRVLGQVETFGGPRDGSSPALGTALDAETLVFADQLGSELRLTTVPVLARLEP